MSIKTRSKRRTVVFYSVFTLLLFILLEVLASTVLLYGYRFTKNDWFVQPGPVRLSSVKIAYEMANRLFLESGPSSADTAHRIEVQPAGFHREDPVLGYVASPGIYKARFHRKPKSSTRPEYLETKVTINEDGSRWTGGGMDTAKATVYFFGDSYVFGSGVSDEHTFAYLFQSARPELRVKLFALGGYGMAEAYILFERLREGIDEGDAIVLGYADFYDIRNVAAPSRLRELRDWANRRNMELPKRRLVKASLSEAGTIEMDHVQQICSQNDGYCDEDDPSRIEMTRVTAALVNHIAENTIADVYLLHFAGESNNPVFGLLDNRVHRLSALEEDFDHFVRDTVENFDSHPGPYWHYALSRFLIDALPD